jgi:hypothetical protein
MPDKSYFVFTYFYRIENWTLEEIKAFFEGQPPEYQIKLT